MESVSDTFSRSSFLNCLDDLQTKVEAMKRLQAETQTELEALLPSVLDRAKGEL